MNRPLAVLVLGFLSLVLTAAPAAAYTGGVEAATFTLAMDGAQVPGGAGDPDGTATGTITLSDLAGLITFEIFFADIDDPVAIHIHQGAAGVEGDPVVTLPVSAGVDPNPLVGVVTPPSLSILQSIINDPTAFYVNIHTVAHPNGAVRAQIPEPSAAMLLGSGLALLAALRRRPPSR